MGRPVKWSRDLHLIRERATHDRTETWGRKDIERLFGVGRATAQSLMKAIGELQPVGGAHFVERVSLLAFLGEMVSAPDFEQALRDRLSDAPAPPRTRPLRIALPYDLRTATVKDLPENIRLSSGHVDISAASAEGVLEALVLLAQIMQNDLPQVQLLLEPPPRPPQIEDDDLRNFLSELRSPKT